ncbi:membrane protein insertase YidC [Hydrogenoanaerobacterium sp.]|uniref:YidC/Oxa1 family membrane protein insertase n=1 Tax=Hydrogenoanaerobacterium sp. TaxID=2953763 RepID=UPI00289AC1B8|nr:membrane protein insertase YidC [Hydrogenoanaerobacterium sp.]
MDFIYTVIGYPLGWVMWACYKLLHNYGLALIVFTLITKLILLPMGINQQKSSVKMAMFKPKMDAITKKYANNKQKQQEEMAALYEKEGYNPMSGCLPLLIQFPILFGLIDVIYKPLTHILRFSKADIQTGIELATKFFGADSAIVRQNVGLRSENLIFKALEASPEFAAQWGQGFADKIASFDQSFLGLDLSQTPGMRLEWLLLIPIISGITSFMLSRISMKMTAATSGDNAAMNGMGKSMMLMMPIMSTIIAFQVPAGVGMYWILTNIFSMAQTWYLNKKYNPAEMLEKAKAEEELRKEQERAERAELKKKMASGEYQEVEQEKALTQKELNRKKLAEARRRDAEKYGEEYTEVTDEDLK